MPIAARRPATDDKLHAAFNVANRGAFAKEFKNRHGNGRRFPAFAPSN
jgi:hypothetical protein